MTELEQHYILRVQWLYGEHGHHFIKTILNLMENKPQLDILDDQFGSPTSTAEVARCANTFLTKETCVWSLSCCKSRLCELV